MSVQNKGSGGAHLLRVGVAFAFSCLKRIAVPRLAQGRRRFLFAFNLTHR
jgi:hypothetical protein